MTMLSFIEVLKIIVFTSVLFVWVVRYDNIISEFKEYKLPAWVRDFVGILKISFVIMLLNSDPFLVLLGSAGIVLLMLGALFTHFRVKNPVKKMLPSVTLLIISLVIFLVTLQ
jgi:hypothetical protein